MCRCTSKSTVEAGLWLGAVAYVSNAQLLSKAFTTDTDGQNDASSVEFLRDVLNIYPCYL